VLNKLADLTYQDFSNIVPRKIDSVLLPIGTIEAHGCTNLGTDITIPEFICDEIAGRMPFLIAPTIPYGITRTLLPYPGSMTVSPETFESYVADVLNSLFLCGFEKVIIMNGHGGHYEQLASAAKNVWRETGGKTLVIHWWDICEPLTKEYFGEAGGHAGINETAMILAKDSALVKPEQCEKVKPYLVRNGAYPYPNPSSILIYKESEGAPKFDEIMAKEYAEKIISFLVSFIEEVFTGWEKHLNV